MQTSVWRSTADGPPDRDRLALTALDPEDPDRRVENLRPRRDAPSLFGLSSIVGQSPAMRRVVY